MMTSPDGFVRMHADKKYKELLSVRDELLDNINKFEANFDKRKGNGNCHPSPEVKYQCHLQYLGKICELIAEKYNREYVWGEDD